MIHALACPAAAPRPTAAVERAARAALRTATGNGNRERAGALNPLSWAAGASAAGRLPCLASPFFGGDSKAACRRLASQLAAHSATMGRSAISHGELAALLVDGEASMPSAWLYAGQSRTGKRAPFGTSSIRRAHGRRRRRAKPIASLCNSREPIDARTGSCRRSGSWCI